MTSCIESPRKAEALDSPRTQRTASIIFDLPQPLGPTMPTRSCDMEIAMGSTNDLNPASLICARRNFLFSGLDGYNSQQRYLRFIFYFCNLILP